MEPGPGEQKPVKTQGFRSPKPGLPERAPGPLKNLGFQMVFKGFPLPARVWVAKNHMKTYGFCSPEAAGAASGH